MKMASKIKIVLFIYTIAIQMIACFQVSNLSSITSSHHHQENKHTKLRFKSSDDDFVQKAIPKKSRVIKSTPIKNLIPVDSLEQFVKAMRENSSNVVVIRAYSPFCKACASIAPSYHRLARRNPKATFLDIAITSKNPDLHEELNVPFVPFGRIYHGETLVNEMKMSKNDWNLFESTVKDVINRDME